MRKSVVASMFYEADPIKLRNQIASFLKKAPQKPDGSLLGVIVPHAGYIYSGACAAYAYKIIAEAKPKTFLILGPDHTGFSNGKTCLSMEDWQTPLGTAKINKKLAEELLAKTSIKHLERAHANEHSIEVQLPFLQFLGNFDFVPVIVSHNEDFRTLAGEMQHVLSNFKDICIICSSDFTHYGPNYDYLPFSSKIKENLYKLDMNAADLIVEKNIEGFLAYIRQTGATICGFAPIALFLEIIRPKANKGDILNYATSGDIIGDYTNSVSYLSIAFFKAKN